MQFDLKNEFKDANKVSITPDNPDDIYKYAVANDPVVIQLNEGVFEFDKTIYLDSNIWISGCGPDKTKLVLKKKSNCNLFENKDDSRRIAKLIFSDFSVDGNLWEQLKPIGCKKLIFSNAFYLKKCDEVIFDNIVTDNIRQTGLHFNDCNLVRIHRFKSSNVGWSGISTSGTNDIHAVDFFIKNSGIDITHSGVHLDGGFGAYLKGVVDICTGNGVMIDSQFSVMQNVIVDCVVTRSFRGVSLSGSVINKLSDVLISGRYEKNREAGILVSNSQHVAINNCKITNNEKYGVLFQGRVGGNNSLLYDCVINENQINVSEIHSSGCNYFVDSVVYSKKSKDIRINIEKNIKHESEIKKNIAESYSGVCSICGREGLFIKNHKFMREGFRCESCRGSLRYRGQAHAIISCFNNDVKSIYELCNVFDFSSTRVYEPGIIGPFSSYFEKNENYYRSYYWNDVKLGDFKDEIQCQNLEELTFSDDFFDLIITSDIFEHIRHPWKAFEEVFRCLKVGGYHVFTIPLALPMRKKTVYRVNTDEEQDHYILEPRYHIAGDGGKSLVYTDFGEDIVSNLEKIGFSVEVVQLDSTNPLISKLITFKTQKK